MSLILQASTCKEKKKPECPFSFSCSLDDSAWPRGSLRHAAVRRPSPASVLGVRRSAGASAHQPVAGERTPKRLLHLQLGPLGDATMGLLIPPQRPRADTR